MLFFSKSNFINSQNFIEPDVSIEPYWYKYAYVNLFSNVGAHIGHTIKNTVRQASWMIYGYKWDLAIINLVFTISSIKSGFILASTCAAKGRPFWFVTQDKTFYRYSRFLALKCGEFSSTLYWIRGMACNYSVVTGHFFIRRPKYVYMRKDKLFDLNFSEWFLTRLTWPTAMLVSSVFFSSFVTREAFTGLIGCVGLLDTNANSKFCTLAIPSNDDSIDWIVFVNDVFAEYILLKKLWCVLRWHYFLSKKIDRLFFFENWVSLQKNINKNFFFRRNFSKKFGKFSIFYFPLWFISSFNSAYHPLVEKVNVYYPEVQVGIAKKIFLNLFNNILIKKKLFAIISSFSLVSRPFFFIADPISALNIGESNWEIRADRSYRKNLYNRWFLKKKKTITNRRWDRSSIFKAFIIKKYTYLLKYGYRFLLHRLNFFFGNSFKYKANWWEKVYIFTVFTNDNFFFWWWRIVKPMFRKFFHPYKFFSSAMYSKTFFFFDPLLSKVDDYTVSLHVSHYMPKNNNHYLVNGKHVNYQKKINNYYWFFFGKSIFC